MTKHRSRRSPVLVALTVLGLVLVVGAGGLAIRALARTGSEAAPAPAARPASTGPSSTAPAAPVAPPQPRCTPAEAVGEIPLRSRLAQLLMVGVDASGPAEALELVRTEQIGGIFLGGNETGLLTGDALAQVQDASALPLTVAIDDEGGRVQRLDDLEGELPSAREMAATMTPEQVYELARERGTAMRARGVTMDLAPSVDTSDQPVDEVIGDRSFSADPAVVTRYADAFARGLHDAGVRPVFKHFPGHGRAEGDSHQGEVSTPPLAELEGQDLQPFEQLLPTDTAAVMMGHLIVPGLTEPGTPASISPAAVALLRDRYGFDGPVLSDDLGAMKAITDRLDLPEAVRQSLAAGVDVALWVTGERTGEVLDHLEASVANGSLPEQRVNEAAARVLAAKGVDPCAGR